MARFSANLGFLWRQLPLPQAIRAAAKSGFDAVECHWPYSTPPLEVRDALEETGLPMISINSKPGKNSGDFGLSALPGREGEAQGAIDEAIEYASEIGAPKIHVMAGYSEGKEAHRAFIRNLHYAAERADRAGVAILIEPLNQYDAPGYFLKTTTQAESIINEITAPNLKLMFDCYHVQIMEGDITRRLERLLPVIGHVQIASVPDRAEPDHGEIDYGHILGALARMGYDSPIGAEYRPGNGSAEGLGWMQRFRGLQPRAFTSRI